MELIIFLCIFCVVIFVIKGIIVVNPSEVVVIERLGKYSRTLNSGVNYIIPIIEYPKEFYWNVPNKEADGSVSYITKKVLRVNLEETFFNFYFIKTTTKDEVLISINAVLKMQVFDPKQAVYEVQNLPDAFNVLMHTFFRNYFANFNLDKILNSKDEIKTELMIKLNESINKWGVKINSLEFQETNKNSH